MHLYQFPKDIYKFVNLLFSDIIMCHKAHNSRSREGLQVSPLFEFLCNIHWINIPVNAKEYHVDMDVILEDP